MVWTGTPKIYDRLLPLAVLAGSRVIMSDLVFDQVLSLL